MLNVKVANHICPAALIPGGTHAVYAIKEAVRAKETTYDGISHPTYKLIPSAFFVRSIPLLPKLVSRNRVN